MHGFLRLDVEVASDGADSNIAAAAADAAWRVRNVAPAGVQGYAHGTWGGVASVYRPHASRSTVRASFPVDSPGGHRVCAPARGYYLAVHDARRRPLRAVCQTRLTVRCRESLTLLPVPCCRRNQRRRCRLLHRLLRGGALVERGARRAVPRRHLRLLRRNR